MNKNEKFACGFRLVLGGWLVYIGISLLWTVNKEKPTNMFFMATMGILCVAIGAVYAGWVVKRLFAIRKAERQEAAEESSFAAEQSERYQEPRKEPVDVTLPVRTEEETADVPGEEETGTEEEDAAAEPETSEEHIEEAGHVADHNVAEEKDEEENAAEETGEQKEEKSEALLEEAERREEIEKDYEEK